MYLIVAKWHPVTVTHQVTAADVGPDPVCRTDADALLVKPLGLRNQRFRDNAIPDDVLVMLLQTL